MRLSPNETQLSGGVRPTSRFVANGDQHLPSISSVSSRAFKISLERVTGQLMRVCLAFLLFGFTPTTAKAQEPQWPAGAAVYLRQNTAALRSISPTDEDFSDLSPVARAIGSARVVQLGESSHGAGEQFEAKARLIRFLHERLGFDVLVWESGLFDCRVANGALHSGMDPTAAASLGVFTIWSDTREVRPLLEYIQATVNTSRPLEIGGFDMQFSSFGGATRLRDALNAFGRLVPDESIRERILSLADRSMQSYQALASRSPQSERQRPDLPGFLATVDSLRRLMQNERTRLEAMHGRREVGFFLHVVDDLREYGRTQYERNAPETPRTGAEASALQNLQWNRRDTQNAANLLWLIREYYAGRKIIVWAHTGHVMNAYYSADWRRLSNEPQPGGMRPTGAFLADSLGAGVYTITMTSYSGAHQMLTARTPEQVPPAPVGSLENWLHRAGYAYAFVNLRPLRGTASDSLLRGMSIRLRGSMSEILPHWPAVMDGVLFIDTARPATPWIAQPSMAPLVPPLHNREANGAVN
jgi:erythromycin esterase